VTQTFEVQNLKCNGCATTIKNALSKKFDSLEVDVEGKKVTAWIKTQEEMDFLTTTLRQLGYPLVSEKIGFVQTNTLKAKSYVSCAVGKFTATEFAK
jgi:copper chaperone CopZ